MQSNWDPKNTDSEKSSEIDLDVESKTSASVVHNWE
jgi:hypothetical protein